MAVCSQFVFILTYLATKYINVRGAGFDLTCFSNYPLLIPDDNNDTFIGGFKGGSDYAQINVAFSRSVDTGTGLDLPTGHSEGDYNGGRSRRLLMPVAGGIERIGAFNCKGEQNGEFHNITAIITHKNGDPRTQHVTITASIGDRVALEVTRDDTSKPIRWSKDGGYVGDFDDQTTIVIESASVSDGGIYDCYYEGERQVSEQAIIRLIVRECPARSWGPPDCTNDCPFCYNGGVCDDKTGDCFCSPGFGGTLCDTTFGRNTFGQEGNHKCKEESSPNSSPGCRGKQLCALDPYGCSCAAGFMGRDCMNECDPGTFGANCKQTCHCADGPSACEYAIGICKTGLCSNGWISDNCQVCERGILDQTVSSINYTSVLFSWMCPVNDATFAVTYKLTNTDQCQPETTNPIILATQRDTSVIISNLSPYSTYDISVAADSWPPCLFNNEAQETYITDEEAPLQEPPNLAIIVQQETSLTFQWDRIECGYRGGDNIMYEYSINSTPPESDTISDNFKTIQNLDACTEYVFNIKAINAAGAGPEASINAATKYRVPADVDGLTVSKTTDKPDELHVTWNSVKCADIYTVLYRKIRIDQCLDTTEPLKYFWDGVDTSVTISGLDAYSTYQVSVYSNNSLGFGVSQENGVTDIEAPSGSPENVTLTSKTNTSLTFEWSRVPCGQRGGPNNFVYTLFDQNDTILDNGTVASLSVTVYSLEPCTSYSIVVKSFNDNGEGNPSSAIYGETVGALGPIKHLKTNKVTASKWNLSWDPQSSSSCQTDEYVVEYFLTNRDQCEDIVDPERVEFGKVIDPVVEITGLYPNSDYTVFITPVNGHGRGVETSSTATTLESGPSGEPQNLIVTDVGTNYLAYSWDQPECGRRNGVITEYVYSLSLSGDVVETGDYFKNTSILINDLNPCSEYRFLVNAIHNDIQGPAAEDFETTETDVPNQPSELKQQDQFEDRTTITWEAPSPQYCEVTKYRVTIRTINKPYDDNFVPDTDPEMEDDVFSTQYTFDELQPSTEYEIQVWAFTEAGPGDLIKEAFYTSVASTSEYLGDALPRVKIKGSTETTVTLDIPQVEDPEQYVTEYHILVEDPNTPAIINSPDFGHYTYVAGAVDVKDLESNSIEFTVGDGQEGSSNPPLKKDKRYIIYIGTCSVISESDIGCVWSEGRSHDHDNNDSKQIILVIFTTVSSTMLIAVSIGAARLYWKNKKLQRQLLNSQNAEMSPYTNLGVVGESCEYEDINTGSINWNISWSQLNISDTILGKGDFGEVREGIIVKEDQRQRVAVKSLKNTASAKDKDDFNSELNTMKRIGHHQNVVSLIGACENEGTLYVAIELLSSGDLRSYLRRIRHPDLGGGNRLPSTRLLNFALDVAKGMDHLSNLGIIHRDLATRNILLDENLVAKVADFGLSRGQNVYFQSSKQRVPTRWLALESLCYNTYTSKSDVWSFAVLVWEIATFGATPYSGIPSRDLPQELTDGYRLPKPRSLDNEMYKLMLGCWRTSPSDRPSFSQISQTLDRMVATKQRNYLDTKAYENVQFPTIEPDRDDN